MLWVNSVFEGMGFVRAGAGVWPTTIIQILYRRRQRCKSAPFFCKEVYEHIIETLQEAETLLMPRTDSEYKKDMYVAVRQKPCWQRYMQRLVRLPCRVVRSLYKVVLRLDVMKMGEQQN